MYKVILTIITAVLLVVALPGCSHTESTSTPTVTAPSLAGPIVEMMLQALNSGDYQSYSLVFGPDMATRTPEQVFTDYRNFIQHRIGQYKSKKLSNVKVDGANTTVTYIAKFSQEPADVQVTIVFQGSGDNLTVYDFYLNSPKLWEH